MDFSQVLTEKRDAIVDRWIESVFQDDQIEATNELTYTAVRDSLPRVLDAMATVLSQSQASDLQTLVDTSLEHGVVRAEQGFEPVEIAREYRLLRSVIFSMLETDLLQAASPREMLRAVRLIDAVIDEAIARCFDSYTNGRFKELEQLQSQLKLTNQELTRLVRASKENMSQLAHELKTPLTSIIGYSDLFLRQQRQNSQDRDTYPNLENIERVLRSGRLLLRLINDSLEIARYDAGKMTLQPVETDVRSVLDSILEIIEPLARSKNLTLEIDTSQAPLQVVTDPLRLQQVLTNLLSNAVRYTDSGSIEVKCQQLTGQQWSITVSDTGIGIPLAAQNQIFEPYFRVEFQPEDAPPISRDGTGLGLSIVSRLVALMQGTITVESQPGQGSRFVIVLPLQVSLAESKPVVDRWS